MAGETMSEIVKVQIALGSSPSSPKPLPLVYDHSRRRISIQSLDKATHQALHGDVKGFFRAEWSNAKQQWLIAERVTDRDW